MKKFDINEYKGKFVMHCKSAEEAKDFCNYLHSIGKKWCSGETYLENTHYSTYGCDTAYNFNQDCYCSVNHFYSYKVLEWSDFMNKAFTKADLRTGDIVKFRNEQLGIANIEFGAIALRDGGWINLNSISDDLKNKLGGGDTYDIIVVRRPTENFEYCFNAIERKLGDLVYERKEVEEMTLEQVCKLLGKEIKIIK